MQLSRIRDDFPLLKKIVYLDSAATSLTPVQVIDAIVSYYKDMRANVHRGAYQTSIEVSERFESAHETILDFFSADGYDVAFTKNATEAINTVASGIEIGENKKNIVVTALEHHSNLIPWQIYSRKRNLELRTIPVDRYGVIDYELLPDYIDRDTGIVAFTHVSNVTGTINNVKAIVELARDNNAITVVDGAQAAGHFPVNLKKISCDFYIFSGHKGVLGPTGSGGFIYRTGLENIMQPLIYGGGMIKHVSEHNFSLADGHTRFEGGTPNIAGIIGLQEGINYIYRVGCRDIAEHEKKLTDKIISGLKNIDNIEIYGPQDLEIHAGVISFNIKGVNPHDTAIILDEVGNIAVRSGFHCAMPLMKYLGCDEGTVRASVHLYNNEDDINRFLHNLEDIVQDLTHKS